jgi:hypothetical protein
MKAYFLLLTVLVLSSFLALKGMADNAPVACPMIAKLCPDGSSVSPKGPNCEIPACPTAKNSITEPPAADDCDDDDCDHKKSDEQND